MEQRRSRRTRALPAHTSHFWLQGVSTVEQLAAAVRSDHTYSCISDPALKKRHLMNAAALPVLRPAAAAAAAAASVSSSVNECQQEQQLSIHGRSVQDYQHIFRSVVETGCSRYRFKRGLGIKQRLWEKLHRPTLLETELPDGRVLITESRSSGSSSAPQIHVDISGEPLPEEEPRRKKPRH
ncbi:uncharacterized protein isoform X4 [Danio rerio]|uniref:Uncharacterized protein isoform X4 n=1 Tax=Danio rerio TaxID=7955 RepID=A0AC58GGK1_DANRE